LTDPRNYVNIKNKGCITLKKKGDNNMNYDKNSGKEKFKEYINTLNDFKSEIAYIFFLMKKCNYDFERHVYRERNLEFLYPFNFSDIIAELLIDKNVSNNDKQLLRTISEYKKLIDEEHIRSNIDLKGLYDEIDEDIIRQYLNNHMNYYLKNPDDLNRQFEIFANTLLKRYDKLSYKTLVFTDSDDLVKFIINNQMEANIVYKDSELSLKESRKIIEFQILVKVLEFDDKIHIWKGDILSNMYEGNNKFDLVAIFYNINYKLPSNIIERKIIENSKIEKLSKKTSISNEYFYINEAYKYLKNNGTITAVISNLALYKTADDEIKKEMIDKKMIKSIVTIPDIFNNHKKEQNIITLQDGNNQIEFNYYREIELLAKSEKVNASKLLDIKEIRDYDLRPSSILLNNNINNPNAKELNNFLKDCYRGCQTSNLNYDNKGEFELLTVSDIDDGIIQENLKRFDYKKKNMDRFLKFLLEENDIIISTHGSRIKIAIAENIVNRKIIPNTNLIVLRPDSNKINPYYLEAYLSSKAGIKSLLNISTGKSNIIINDINIRKLSISIKDLNMQNKIGKVIKDQRDEIAFLKKRLMDAIREKNSFIEKVLEDLIDG